MLQIINRFLNFFIKLFMVIDFFTKKVFLLTVFSILILTFSQFFLIIAYLLPIKIIILLSMNSIPSILSTVFNGFTRETIILILAFFVFISYGVHLILEQLINRLIKRNFKLLAIESEKVIKDVILKRFLENFFRLMSTFLLIVLLFCSLIYLFPQIAGVLFAYLFVIMIIFFSRRIKKENVIKYFHVSFFLGFIIVFIYEVVFILYYSEKEISIITILVSIVIVRYIFLRGVFIVSKLLVLFRDLKIININPKMPKTNKI